METPQRVGSGVGEKIRRQSRRKLKVLLLGTRGVGKSTELLRCAEVLRRSGPGQCRPIRLPIDKVCDPDRIGADDILYLATMAVLGSVSPSDDAAVDPVVKELQSAYAPEPGALLGDPRAALEGFRKLAVGVQIAAEIASTSFGLPPGTGDVAGGVIAAGVDIVSAQSPCSPGNR